MTPRRPVRVASRLGLLAVPLLAVLVLAAGCGGAGFFEVGVGVGYGDGYYEDPYYYEPAPLLGAVALDNRTDATTFEAVLAFHLAPAATGAFSDDLLPGPLPPGALADLGAFVAGSYDAHADLELGAVVDWYDVFVAPDEVTTFEVW